MIVQGSREWFALKAGKVSASCIGDMLSRTKSGWGATRLNYRAKLVAERLTGITEEGYKSYEMIRGNEVEPEARAAYEFYTGHTVTVAPEGFVDHPTIPMCGASPDSYVNDDGLVEIKCPNTSTHIETLLGRNVPGKYVLQCQWQMACTGRAWCDWVSFDPRMPEEMRLFIRRIERDDEKIKEITDHVVCFLKEIDDVVSELTKLYRQQEAA
jgi:putative phage-type endonuclease